MAISFLKNLRYLFIYGSAALVDFGCFFSFLILYTVRRTSWMGDQPVKRPLPPHSTAQAQNKRTQTSTPQVGFKPTIPLFERAKTLYVLRWRGHCDRHLHYLLILIKSLLVLHMKRTLIVVRMIPESQLLRVF
jgi:hypothetical protein